jgi:hypothetical protein
MPETDGVLNLYEYKMRERHYGGQMPTTGEEIKGLHIKVVHPGCVINTNEFLSVNTTHTFSKHKKATFFG